MMDKIFDKIFDAVISAPEPVVYRSSMEQSHSLPNATSKKRKFKDFQNLKKRDKAKKRNSKEITTKDRLLEWNYFYSNVKFGLWIECTKCKKWRKSEEYEEDHNVPVDWSCSMNLTGIKNCDEPEDTEDAEFSPVRFIPGSIVWAKIDGYPWWPAMIEDDPDTEEYFWFEDGTWYYNVTFLDDKVSHSWVPLSRVCSYLKTSPQGKHLSKKKNKWLNLIEAAEKTANKALDMTIKERLQNFSFVHRYKGKWPNAIKLPEDNGDGDLTEMLIREVEDIESLDSFDSDTIIDNASEKFKKQKIFDKNENMDFKDKKQKISTNEALETDIEVNSKNSKTNNMYNKHTKNSTNEASDTDLQILKIISKTNDNMVSSKQGNIQKKVTSKNLKQIFAPATKKHNLSEELKEFICAKNKMRRIKTDVPLLQKNKTNLLLCKSSKKNNSLKEKNKLVNFTNKDILTSETPTEIAKTNTGTLNLEEKSIPKDIQTTKVENLSSQANLKDKNKSKLVNKQENQLEKNNEVLTITSASTKPTIMKAIFKPPTPRKETNKIQKDSSNSENSCTLNKGFDADKEILNFNITPKKDISETKSALNIVDGKSNAASMGTSPLQNTQENISMIKNKMLVCNEEMEISADKTNSLTCTTDDTNFDFNQHIDEIIDQVINVDQDEINFKENTESKTPKDISKNTQENISMTKNKMLVCNEQMEISADKTNSLTCTNDDTNFDFNKHIDEIIDQVINADQDEINFKENTESKTPKDISKNSEVKRKNEAKNTKCKTGKKAQIEAKKLVGKQKLNIETGVKNKTEKEKQILNILETKVKNKPATNEINVGLVNNSKTIHTENNNENIKESKNDKKIINSNKALEKLSQHNKKCNGENKTNNSSKKNVELLNEALSPSTKNLSIVKKPFKPVIKKDSKIKKFKVQDEKYVENEDTMEEQFIQSHNMEENCQNTNKQTSKENAMDVDAEQSKSEEENCFSFSPNSNKEQSEGEDSDPFEA